MKILLANKFFYDHGGPETVLFAEREILRAAGHEVIDFSMRDPRNRISDYAAYFAPPIDLQSVKPTPASVRTAWRFLDSKPAADSIRQLVRDHRPDVAHLHSINHQLTPSIIRVLREERVPVVMTLHDYKLVCPAYTLLADGKICERCTGGRFFNAVRANCRGPVRSPLLAAESYIHHSKKKSYDGVALFLAPSQFLAGKFHEMGFKHPIEVLPNPLTTSPGGSPRTGAGDHFLFVGRAVEEKGLRTLCAAALRAGVEVRIAGDGPQLFDLQRDFDRYDNIKFLGRVAPEHARALMRNALATLVPSEWYENQSMVILESLSQGTPVIASDLGGNPELVRDGETGLLHAPGSVVELAARLAYARDHAHEMTTMGDRGRAFSARFSPPEHLRQLLSVYDRVLAASD
jgi:glycosyltransferase involved in cell wall biosynthesis